jgi:hypothetical protein
MDGSATIFGSDLSSTARSTVTRAAAGLPATIVAPLRFG